jgi:hypothetical protein
VISAEGGLPDTRIRIARAIGPGSHQAVRSLVRASFDGLEADLGGLEVRVRVPWWRAWKFDGVAYDGVPLWRIPPSRIGRLRWLLPSPANSWRLTRRLASLDPGTKWLVVLTVPRDLTAPFGGELRIPTFGGGPELVVGSGLEYLAVVAGHTADKLARLQAERRQQDDAKAAPDRWAAVVLDRYRREVAATSGGSQR